MIQDYNEAMEYIGVLEKKLEIAEAVIDVLEDMLQNKIEGGE